MGLFPFFKHYPGTNLHEIDLDYVLREADEAYQQTAALQEWADQHEVLYKDLENTVEGLVNHLTDVIVPWDSSIAYQVYSLVEYQGTNYIALQDVPVGVMITNTEYWQPANTVTEQLNAIGVTVSDLQKNLYYTTPEDYGAAGDGVTDDSAAIQAAIDSGICVMFSAEKTYVAHGLMVRRGILRGNGCTIDGKGEDVIFTAKTYDSGQTHTAPPAIYVSGFHLKNATTLLKCENLLKATFENIGMEAFSVGVLFTAGYENTFRGFRFEGDSSNTSATGVYIQGGGDSTFEDFFGRDVANPLHVSTTNNLFVNWHFWIIDQSLFDSTVFIKEDANSAAVNKYVDFYFDSFKVLLDQGGYSSSLFESPSVVANSNLISGMSTFVKLTQTAFNTQNIRILNAKFTVDANTLCDICSDHTKPIYITHLPVSGAQYAKIHESNVFVPDTEPYVMGAANWITLAEGVTVKSSQIIRDDGRRIITVNAVFEKDTNPGTTEYTLGTLNIPPAASLNSYCMVAYTEWGPVEPAYLFVGSTISVRPQTSDRRFTKVSFTYRF